MERASVELDPEVAGNLDSDVDNEPNRSSSNAHRDVPVPKTVVVAPSPPETTIPLPPVFMAQVLPEDHQTGHNGGIGGSHDDSHEPQRLQTDNGAAISSHAKRISSPFELDSPLPSPTPEKNGPFQFPQSQPEHSLSQVAPGPTSAAVIPNQGEADQTNISRASIDEPYRPSEDDLSYDNHDHENYLPQPDARRPTIDTGSRGESYSHEETRDSEANRDSLMSTTSSEALGGIGGFMMGGSGSAEGGYGDRSMESTEELAGGWISFFLQLLVHAIRLPRQPALRDMSN